MAQPPAGTLMNMSSAGNSSAPTNTYPTATTATATAPPARNTNFAPSTHPAPSSPTHTRKHSTSLADTVPLDHPSRTHPIHPSLPTLALLPQPPTTALASNLNPLNLQPFTTAELVAHKYDELRARFTSNNAPSSSSSSEGGDAQQQAAAATAADTTAKQLAAEQEEVARQIKARMEERQRKEAEIDKEIGEMEKIREVERKIYRRRMGGKEGV